MKYCPDPECFSKCANPIRKRRDGTVTMQCSRCRRTWEIAGFTDGKTRAGDTGHQRDRDQEPRMIKD